jgi:prephenate dehydrogenase
MTTAQATGITRRLVSTRICIIGLGLMGGSLAMALRGKCSVLVGIDTDPQACEFALRHAIVDEIVDMDTAFNCDLLVLAAPVRAILDSLQQLTKTTAGSQSPVIVIDLGSTKTEILRAMQALPECFDPIGGHPMCGKEASGIAQSEAALYRGKIFILSPLERTSPSALTLANELVAAVGAEPLLLSAEKQDILVAMVSHLPYVIACALMSTALCQDDPQVWKLAASGFRDTSRLAASDLTMMVDILLTNRDAILNALQDYHTELDTLATLIQAGDEQGLRKSLAPVVRQRAAMYQ